MPIAVLCDFDGTIVDIDTAEYVLDLFSEGDWRQVDRLLEKGEISLEECMQRQFSMIRASEEIMVQAIDETARTRPNFRELVDFCHQRNIPLIITSAGLGFYIRYFLRKNDWEERVLLIVPEISITDEGVRFLFPEKRYLDSISFKDDTTRRYQDQGYRVAYIGDGLPDFSAARIADEVFAVRESKLAVLLSNNGIAHRQFDDFRSVVEALKEMEI